MQCRKCNEEIKAGYTFCRRCATSIYVDDEQLVPTNYVNKNKITELKSKVYTKSEYKPLEVNNKDLMNKNQNDRKLATLKNIGSLALILLVIFILVLLFLKILKML